VQVGKNNMELDIEFYVQKIKEHEEKRLSTNERQAFWIAYRLAMLLENSLDEETGFDMSKFSNEIK
tara:strand:- start:353 stop:550 length:198 start_codon:yes stop_codon:yes gene_type:complete